VLEKPKKQNKKRVLKYKVKKKKELQRAGSWETARGEREERERQRPDTQRQRQRQRKQSLWSSGWEGRGVPGAGAAVAGWLQHCVWKTRIQRKKIWIALYIAAHDPGSREWETGHEFPNPQPSYPPPSPSSLVVWIIGFP
jgi:hypothetical protein